MKKNNFKNELGKFVSPDITAFLDLCSKAAESLSLKIFLIGGLVRDIIICDALKDLNSFHGKINFDTDITVQGNAVDFAYFLEKTYPEFCKIKEIHDKFKTAKILFCINNENIEIDLASTRKESYPYPGSLPFVEEIGCNLYEDVIRRDFSINSIALSLNQNDFGDLTDYLSGYEDIKNKKIKVLHEKSFVDDPTRIIRALKFRVRFGYELDENTKDLQHRCIESGLFDNICGERIKSEIKQTFNLNKAECADIFINENICRFVNKDIKTSEIITETCESVIKEYFNFINPDFIWLIYLGLMISDLSKNKISEISQKLYLSGIEAFILTEAKTLFEKNQCFNTNFEIYEFFQGLRPESILIFVIKQPELKEKADFYLKKLKDIKIYTTGQDLLDLGVKQGPAIGQILRKLLKAKINGEFSSKEDEDKFLKQLIS